MSGETLRVEFCWVDDPGEEPLPGQPAYALPGVAAAALRARRIEYRGPATLDALMADPQVADLAGRVARGHWRIAVYGKPARPGMPVYDGDRIELLGPITADPKAARHARVRAERARRGAGKWGRGSG